MDDSFQTCVRTAEDMDEEKFFLHMQRRHPFEDFDFTVPLGHTPEIHAAFLAYHKRVHLEDDESEDPEFDHYHEDEEE